MDQHIDSKMEAAGEHSVFENGYLNLRNSIHTLSEARLEQGNDKVSEAVNGLNNLVGISKDVPVLSFVKKNQDLVNQSKEWEKRTWEDLSKFKSSIESTEFMSPEARESAIKYVESLEENLGIPDHVKGTDYILRKINEKQHQI